ncbi:MAG: hypothetical protein D6734_13025 [Candidatus Schekmanbacteria bacterium]|nr:MAG: hypothetical protein D6734_13025 [Candidatus Schekmanbacteria bacterium]
MSLLYEIQESIVQSDADIGPVLLKLRLLAARLGSVSLEEWVKYESEGYPTDIEVPPYRIIGVSYRGTFSGPFGSGIKNAPIPSYLIEKFAGKQWTRYQVRESIAAIDELLNASSDKGGSLEIDASDLILLLQGKIYPDYACNEIRGTVSRAAFAEIRHSVKNRILELTIQIEKTFPEATKITFGSLKINKVNSEEINKISTQVIYGNVTNITTGDGAQFIISVGKGDNDSLIRYLVESGIPEDDAKVFSEILASEEPAGKDEPFGLRAKTWLLENLKKAANGTWKVGISVATQVLTEAALKYYGFK